MVDKHYQIGRREAIEKVAAIGVLGGGLGTAATDRAAAAPELPDLRERHETKDVVEASYEGYERYAEHRGIHSLVVNEYEPQVGDDTSGHILAINEVMRTEGSQSGDYYNDEEGRVKALQEHVLGASVFDPNEFDDDYGGWWDTEDDGEWRYEVNDGDSDAWSAEDTVEAGLDAGVTLVSSALSFGPGLALSAGYQFAEAMWNADYDHSYSWDPFDDNFYEEQVRYTDYSNHGGAAAEASSTIYYYVSKPRDNLVEVDLQGATLQTTPTLPSGTTSAPSTVQTGPRLRVNLPSV